MAKVVEKDCMNAKLNLFLFLLSLLQCKIKHNAGLCLLCRYLFASSYVEKVITDTGEIYRETNNVVC